MYQVSLKAARVNAGMTQMDAANALGKSKQTVINWENGVNDIKYRDLLKLADLYRCPIEMLRI